MASWHPHALCWRRQEDFPGGAREGQGPGGVQGLGGEEGLSTAGSAGSCPQETATAKSMRRACCRMSYQLFQELAVILTAVFTKVDQLLPAQPWSLTPQLSRLMSVQSRSAIKTQRHRADNAIKKVPPVLEWETRAPCL